jgi:hypothetical protein
MFHQPQTNASRGVGWQVADDIALALLGVGKGQARYAYRLPWWDLADVSQAGCQGRGWPPDWVIGAAR